ncbi:Nudix hydrolase nudL [Corynebacterium kutscheri]|uniref:NUDIX family protein n=1 Tax=Corynebacterium kutscheri TaxID=35755 RepID=A0A0F6TBZ9_9CORY|nr:CoA pyrophosphatase [Corynebacterium kutscheri]AKE40416.1 NUDIX family protein [Corynebacterium kutscheri]VEH05247.1 Nudix hydrolase nudL [Corynebacterium kutscheri]VEH10811.1 Nudix hydrolase nudL [Corynebacterium kutscheri]VEH80710.1 Nudix hydrolase nudL [Corynebacterium kutscheri]
MSTPPWLRLFDDQRLQHINRRLMPGRESAVLMLFSGSSDAQSLPGDARVLLTHRSPSLRTHSGQIAFPGGRVDPEDTDIVDTALREAWEETGLDRRTVTPLAQLDEVNVRINRDPVHPIVAYWHTPSVVGVVDPGEADDVFLADVHALLDPTNRLLVGFDDWSGPAFRYDGYLIWGLTGGLLDTFFQQAGWQEPWDHRTRYDLMDVLRDSRNNEKH